MLITDPQQITYRTALQREYEMIIEDLIILIADLSVKQMPSEKDFEAVNNKVRDFANDYMELQSSYWKKTDPAIREMIIDTVSENLVSQIPNYKTQQNLVEAFIIETMPALIHALFIQYLESVAEAQAQQPAVQNQQPEVQAPQPQAQTPQPQAEPQQPEIQDQQNK